MRLMRNGISEIPTSLLFIDQIIAVLCSIVAPLVFNQRLQLQVCCIDLEGNAFQVVWEHEL